MNKAFTNLCGIGVLLFAVLACANLPNGDKRPRNSSTVPSNLAPSSKISPSTGNWSYSDTEDQMGRGKIHSAKIESTNTISLDFPYGGEQHATLILREHPKHGKDVYFMIERGQLLDSEYNNPVLVRFDNDRPISFSSTGPSDHSTETLFLGGNAFSVFTNRLKTAKTVRIEAPIYQGGNQVFVFDVEGFSWRLPQKSP